MKSKIIPAVIAVLIIALIAVAYLFAGHSRGTQSPSTIASTNTITPISTISPTTTIPAPVITYASNSAGGVGQYFNLSVPVPPGYVLTNKALNIYTMCPSVYVYFYPNGNSGEVGSAYPELSPKGIPYCSLEDFGFNPQSLKIGPANDIANGTLMFQAGAIVEVYNASGVNITEGVASPGLVPIPPSGMYSQQINYTINNTFSSLLTIISLQCYGGLPCSISTPNGCKIIQHAAYQNPYINSSSDVGNSSVTLEACSNQKPGTYNFTINSSYSSGIPSWVIARYHAGMPRQNPNQSSFSAPMHQIFVTNFADDSVSVINASNYTVVKAIQGFQQPQAIAISPNGAQVFVANYGGDTLSVVNTLTDSIVKSISVGQNPVSVVFSPDGNRAYAVNGNNGGQGNVYVINTITDTVINTISLGYGAGGIAVLPDGSKVLVAKTGGIAIINASNDRVINNISTFNYNSSSQNSTGTGFNPSEIALSPNGAKLFAISYGGWQFDVINTTTDTIIKNVTPRIVSFTNGCQIAVSPNGAQLIIPADGPSGAVIFINTTTYDVTKTIRNMSGPCGMAFSPGGNKLFISNLYPSPGQHYVDVFNATTYAVINTITVGGYPSGIAVT